MHLNIWAPSQEWAEAFNDTITPVTDSSENTTYLFDIDSVHVAKLSTNYGTNSSDVLIGTSYNDWISGIDGDDTVCGGNGDDVIFGGFGDDNIDGGEGEDTITLTGLPSQYFLFENSMSGLEGVDALLNVEHFRFGSSLENILCICNLTAEDLTDPDGGGPEVSPAEDLLQGISDLYVAFFNRAPDVGGLMYWFKEVMNGTWSVATIAQSFTDQVEYKATYPDGLSNREFIETIYQNLFDREPDTAGWDYWENDLNHGTPRNVFIYTVIQGAYAPTGGASDRALLNNKHDVSLYYSEQLATHSSESFDNNIDEVLDRVTSNSQTVEDAEAVIDYVMDHEITLTGVVQDVELWESFWG